ncbi:hypothetical protein ABZV29_16885 [Streptomyces sp. NPDC005236]|uniref:hypothetical protein n=1 Tax=Streptomyces sp. NPDC005236 TaxID=3157028 RepID=UPI0033AB21D5
MNAPTGYGRPRLVASAAGRGPAVHARYRVRLLVDKYGIVQPRPAGRPDGLLPIYQQGAVAEVHIGNGTCIAGYNADIIAESFKDCDAVHLISDAAEGHAPVLDHGTAYNAEDVLRLLSEAIEQAAASRGTAAC